MHPKRPCPICLGAESKLIFRQTFATLSESSLMDGYDVVICGNCGGSFSDRIPRQDVFDRYYAEMSKYTSDNRDGKISEADAARFREIADAVVPYLKPGESIVDVGCATGGLLAEFKRRDWTNLIGFEPSPACTETARRLYDIEVRPVGLSSLDKATERFDLVILTVVLEHVCDLDASLASLTKLLKPGGRLYLEVPDAASYYQWFSAPFQFFSMEHINYFSKKSLANLLARHGFTCSFARTVVRYGSPKSVEPAVSALFAYTGKPTPIIYDDETEPALAKYIDFSQTLETRINGIIGDLAVSGEPLAVWGTGTHTLRLLKTSPLPRTNLVAFLDSNSAYQGKTLNGIPIVAPAQFTRPDATILISSHVFEQEIQDQIKNQLRWPNKIVRLYEDAPTQLM